MLRPVFGRQRSVALVCGVDTDVVQPPAVAAADAGAELPWYLVLRDLEHQRVPAGFHRYVNLVGVGDGRPCNVLGVDEPAVEPCLDGVLAVGLSVLFAVFLFTIDAIERHRRYVQFLKVFKHVDISFCRHATLSANLLKTNMLAL